MLGKTKLNIADSTEITTDRYEERIRAGKPTRKLVTYKLHSLIGYYPKEHLTVIKDGIGSDKHISDSEGAVRMMDSLSANDSFFTDRGFDYEIYKKIRGIIETIFGGFEIKGLSKTRLRKDQQRHKYSLIIQIRHNLNNLLRLRSINYIMLLNCSTNSVLTKVL